MASVVDICNLALANLGHNAEVTAIVPPDGSQEAAYCNRFYPIARNSALEMSEWGFATKRVTLASLGSPPTGWLYRYAFPSNVIRPLRIYETGTDPLTKPQGEPYEIESDDDGTVVLTNVEDAEMQYISIVTDTTKYTPSFTQAVAWMLASYLAGPLTQDLKLAEYCEQRAIAASGRAAVFNADAQKASTMSAINRRYPIGRARSSVQVTDAD